MRLETTMDEMYLCIAIDFLISMTQGITYSRVHLGLIAGENIENGLEI